LHSPQNAAAGLPLMGGSPDAMTVVLLSSFEKLIELFTKLSDIESLKITVVTFWPFNPFKIQKPAERTRSVFTSGSVIRIRRMAVAQTA
jgi:hypothetical protein